MQNSKKLGVLDCCQSSFIVTVTGGGLKRGLPVSDLGFEMYTSENSTSNTRLSFIFFSARK